MLECVVNVSEGRNEAVIEAIAASAGPSLLDIHRDPWHHRSVFTLAGPDLHDAVRALAETTVGLVDIAEHAGSHPRFGALDVVPFVPLDATGAPVGGDGPLGPAITARAHFARWAAETLRLPCFFYGPERTLHDVRRQAFVSLAPDVGPSEAHPTAGACAVGARPGLVAYNLWLASSDVGIARAIAAAVRSSTVRSLGFRLDAVTQVSCNLVEPAALGPAEIYDTVHSLAIEAGTEVTRAELVGLVPGRVLDAIAAERWSELDLALDRTVEARLAARFGR